VLSISVAEVHVSLPEYRSLGGVHDASEASGGSATDLTGYRGHFGATRRPNIAQVIAVQGD
jgi:hypothetical protein